MVNNQKYYLKRRSKPNYIKYLTVIWFKFTHLKLLQHLTNLPMLECACQNKVPICQFYYEKYQYQIWQHIEILTHRY